MIAIPVLLGVTLLAFVVLNVLPGSAARQLLGTDATPEEVAAFEIKLGLNRPASERYVEWLKHVAHGDLGKSIASGQPVTRLMKERLGVTASLAGLAFFLALAIAVPAALLAAHRPGGFADRVTMVMAMAGVSAPSYVAALVLVLIFAVHFGWLPSMGAARPGTGLLEHLRSLALPAISVALPFAALYARFLRNDLMEQLNREDYVVTAIAKGLGSWRVLLFHVFRNSLFGLLTLVGVHLGSLIGGAVLIEQIFALPGIGRLLLDAVYVRDASLVQGVVLLVAATTVLANLCVDLLYAVLDPRVRHAHG